MMTTSPRVVVDVRMVRHAGIGTYIRNVVPRVMAARPSWRFTLLAGERARPEWQVAAPNEIVTCSAGIYSVREQVELSWKAGRADVVWSPHYVVPLFARARHVVTVHDVAHLSLAHVYAPGIRGVYARAMFGAVRRRASEVIYDSEYTRNEFLRFVGRPKSGTVIPLGVDPSWTAPVAGHAPHERPYFLFLGSIKPHKNLGALLDAFARASKSIPHDLVIVGNAAEQRTLDAAALRRIDELGARARFVGDADDAQVKRFVAHAAALIVPSMFEGFGLPVLEAMAAGCPCIVSNATSLPEVGGEAVLYCDPNDPGTIEAQMMRLLADDSLRCALIGAGRERAARFTWDACAERTAAVLERAIAAA